MQIRLTDKYENYKQYSDTLWTLPYHAQKDSLVKRFWHCFSQ